MAETKKSSKKNKKVCPFVTIYISVSSNNTRLVATENGNVLAWSSAGAAGFKGTKKSTPHAASEATTVFIDKLRNLGVKTANIILKGILPTRESAIKTLAGSGIMIQKISDLTSISHNGTRRPSRRRI